MVKITSNFMTSCVKSFMEKIPTVRKLSGGHPLSVHMIFSRRFLLDPNRVEFWYKDLLKIPKFRGSRKVLNQPYAFKFYQMFFAS